MFRGFSPSLGPPPMVPLIPEMDFISGIELQFEMDYKSANILGERQEEKIAPILIGGLDDWMIALRLRLPDGSQAQGDK